MRIESFEEIKAWQEAKLMTVEAYGLTRNSNFSRDFSLCDQIRRACVSVMANIAEGFGRNSGKEFIRFLHIAKASAFEVQSHLHIARELEYISHDQFSSCYQRCASAIRLIGGFINYLSNQSNKPNN
jgi:four helix bundle protein